MEGYTKAQQDALCLLRTVDQVCAQENIRYSLAGIALVWQEYGFDFDRLNPNVLSVCLLYEDYVRLTELLERRKSILGIVVANHGNRENFDTLSTWIFREEECLLPAGRGGDEIYYRTPLFIQPVYYAGRTERDYKKAEKEIAAVFRLLNARAPLPHKRWFSGLRKKYGRMRGRIYRSQRIKKNPSIVELNRKLVGRSGDRGGGDRAGDGRAGGDGESGTEEGYLIFRNEGGRISKLSVDEFQVRRVRFMSVDTYVFADSRKIVERNYPHLLTPPDRKVSDLLLQGGKNLRKVQLIQLEMMAEIDRICRKYGLKYNIAFGTLLGAVRHKGFIPWDDDADINMPYEDYEKLKQVMEQEIDHEKYYFRVQEKEADCNITYAHLKRNGTVYTKPGREGFRYHPGVYIDIVPIFNGAPNLLLHSIQTRICWFFRTACWAHMGAEGEKNHWKKRYYRMLAKIGNKRAYRLFIKFASMCRHKRGKMLFLNGLDRSPYNIPFVRRECYDQPIELEFEGHLFYAPADYGHVLEYCYGKDYMMYPPLIKRKPKNNVVVRLEVSGGDE